MGKAGSPSVLVLYPEYTGSFQNIFISPPEHSLWFVIAPSKWASAYNAGDPSSIPGSGGSAREGISYPLQYSWASLVAQLVKNLPAMQETWVRSLDWEEPLKKGKATHSSILAWRIPWTPWGCKELDMIEQLSLYFVRSILHLDL